MTGFRRLWLSLAFGGVGNAASQLGLSWIVLVATDSPLAVGIQFAGRMLPSLVLGIPFGALTDRLDRRLVLVRVNVLAGVASVGIAAGVALGWPTFAVAVAGSLLLGTLDMFRVTASQAYVVDLVGIAGARRGVALANVAPQTVAAVGALVGGAFLERYGSPLTFVLAGGAWLVAALILATRSRPSPISVPHPSPDSDSRPSPDLRRAVALVLGNRDVRALVVLIALTEILGFSSLVLAPTFARDVLGIGAAGLGFLLAARSIGAVAGLLALARLRFARSPTLFIGSIAALAIGQIAFGLSNQPALSLVLCLGIGAAAACCDALGQTLLQQAVPDSGRGAAMGVWIFSLGFGPIGFVAIGAVASVVGAPAAQVGAGVALLVVALLAVVMSPVRELGRTVDAVGPG